MKFQQLTEAEKKNLTKQDLEVLIADAISEEINTTIEVNIIGDSINVYTEDLRSVEKAKELMEKVNMATFSHEFYYEADEDLPASWMACYKF